MPFSTNYRCPPVTIMLSWQHARWKGRLDKAWNKVCIAERECCTFHLCVRPNLFSRMRDKWSIISLLPSLPWPICGSRLAGHLCCCPAVSRAAPTSLHTAPFLQNGLPFNNNQMAFFLVFLKTSSATSSKQASPTNRRLSGQFNCLTLHSSDFT